MMTIPLLDHLNTLGFYFNFLRKLGFSLTLLSLIVMIIYFVFPSNVFYDSMIVNIIFFCLGGLSQIFLFSFILSKGNSNENKS